jgi:hypothetical protein
MSAKACGYNGHKYGESYAICGGCAYRGHVFEPSSRRWRANLKPYEKERHPAGCPDPIYCAGMKRCFWECVDQYGDEYDNPPKPACDDEAKAP